MCNKVLYGAVVCCTLISVAGMCVAFFWCSDGSVTCCLVMCGVIMRRVVMCGVGMCGKVLYGAGLCRDVCCRDRCCHTLVKCCPYHSFTTSVQYLNFWQTINGYIMYTHLLK